MLLPDRIRALVRSQGAIARAFVTDDGALALLEIMRMCGVLESSFTPNHPHETAYREGRRSVALELLAKLRWTEADLVRLAQQQVRAQPEEQD